VSRDRALDVSPPSEPAVSPSRLAEEWGVDVQTVYRDIRKGALPAFRLPSGRFRIRRDDARRYGRPYE
jgi:predicted site-specific integrase-resolvase